MLKLKSEPKAADIARQATAEFQKRAPDEMYERLLGIIQEIAAKGASDLALRWEDSGAHSELVYLDHSYHHYKKGSASATIYIASIIDQAQLAKRLKADGFEIDWDTIQYYGRVVDRVSW